MHPFIWRLAMAALAMAPARAQPPVEPPGALTLATARTLAQAFHPAIAAAQHELDAAGGAQLQAGARPNPELGLLVEDTRSATRATTVQINQPIELGGKRDARLAVAGRAREQAAAALAAARADAGASAAAAFDEVLGAQDALALAVSTRDVAARTGAIADKRVAAGKRMRRWPRPRACCRRPGEAWPPLGVPWRPASAMPKAAWPRRCACRRWRRCSRAWNSRPAWRNCAWNATGAARRWRWNARAARPTSRCLRG
jgi:hypothetical protein